MSFEPVDKERERFQILLTKAVDGELSEEEYLEFQEVLRRRPEWERDWHEHQKVKEVTKSMRLKAPPAEVWDRYWLQVYNRIERGLAWILTSLGAIILLSYAVYQAALKIWADTHLPGVVKFGILTLVVGAVMLVVSILREKLFVRKQDKYREVQR